MRSFVEKEEEEDIFVCNKSLFTHIYRERERLQVEVDTGVKRNKNFDFA